MAINPVAHGEFSSSSMTFVDAVLAAPSLLMFFAGLWLMVVAVLGDHRERSVGGFFCGLGSSVLGVVLGATGTGWVAVGLMVAYFKWFKK